jgi:hypothetical protein
MGGSGVYLWKQSQIVADHESAGSLESAPRGKGQRYPDFIHIRPIVLLMRVDSDEDGLADAGDNCPLYATANLVDTDGDGRGNACEYTDQNGDGRNTVSDLVAINVAIFNPGLVTPLCDGNNAGLTMPTLGASAVQLRLNCCSKKGR